METLYFNDELITEDGWLILDKENVVTINGCDAYALPKLINRFEFQRPK